MQRTNSESSSTGPPPKGWRFGSALRKIGSRTFTSQDKASLYRKPSLGHEIDPHETFHTRPDYASIHESSESSGKQLQLLIQRMRAAPTGASHVDSAYKEFTKIYVQAATLCSAILQEEIKSPISSTAVTETGNTNRESSIESPPSHATAFDNRSSFSGRSLGEVITGSGTGRSALHHSDVWLAPIRDWKACLENLTEAFKVSLADTYKSYERDATPEMLESLFASKKFRRDAVARMRNASVTRVLSADPQFFPRYEIRFRNYEKIKTELGNIRQILQGGESGISPSRTVLEFDISPHGDAVLEFANLQPDASPHDPVLRFRVSPHVLAETSPIFARMFAGRSSSMLVHDIEDITTQLPSPPSRYYCKDGTEAWLYRMPQHEVNRHNAMETLMHAAHMHNNVVPRDVTFDQFVAIAECSIRYKSTSPLELMVEHRWLPQWMHRGADDMPDGLLIISYAFGCRGLFSRMSKSAILNLVDERDLQSKPWPQKIKDKMWAVRSAKVAQLYECCTSLLQEYLQPPTSEPQIDTEAEPVPPAGWTGFNAGNAPVKPSMSLMSTPRCPKGSHWCDATTMGWLMLVFNNMNLLSPILQSPTVCSKDTNHFPAKSLAQIVDLLRSIPSPQAPVHRGSVCDPIPSFRTAVGDIYNTVIGLTLHDVSGKSHGWALSKNLSSEPQMEEATGLRRMAAHDDDYTVAAEFPESIILRILSEIADLEDLHAAARINRPFYETYKMYELPLMRNILRVGRVRGGSVSHPRIPIISTNAEGKSLTSDLPLLTERSMDERTGSMTGRSAEDDSEASSSSDESSDDEMPEPSPDHDSSDQLPPDYEPVDVSRPSRGQMASDRSSAASSSVSRGSATRGQDSSADQRSDSFGPSREHRSPAFMTGGQNEEQMTEEEARRILWPDDYEDDEQRRLQNQTRTPSTATIVPSSGVGVREKFRLGDPSFAEGLEDKTLISVEAKQLKKQREQHSSPQGARDDESNDGAD